MWGCTTFLEYLSICFNQVMVTWLKLSLSGSQTVISYHFQDIRGKGSGIDWKIQTQKNQFVLLKIYAFERIEYMFISAVKLLTLWQNWMILWQIWSKITKCLFLGLFFVLTRPAGIQGHIFIKNRIRLIRLTAHNWQKWKRVFLSCPCNKMYRVEAVGLKSSNYTWKIMIFAIMSNLRQFREKWYFVNNCLLKVRILKILSHICDTYNCDYFLHTIFRFRLIDFQLNKDFPSEFCVLYRKIT